MIAVVQRSGAACVRVGGRTVGAIERGLVAFVAVVHGDGPAQVAWLARKLATLRLFPGPSGRMDRSVSEAGGGVLLVSNFTVAGQVGKGTRPDFSRAAKPDEAFALIEALRDAVAAYGLPVATGEFGADMQVEVSGDGPVTIILDRPPATKEGDE